MTSFSFVYILQEQLPDEVYADYTLVSLPGESDEGVMINDSAIVSGVTGVPGTERRGVL